MPRALLANNASTTLSGTITTAVQTTFSIVSATGFPTVTTASGNHFWGTLTNGSTVEVVRVTDITGTTVTCTRGQDGTTAQASFPAGTTFSLNTTKALLSELAPLDNPQFTGGIKEQRNAMAANNIDLNLGNVFTKTISGATTLTVSNVPSTGNVATFILDLTNGGVATITWWSGIKWTSGQAPVLTASGRDMLGFLTHDGGTTWSGLLLGKDIK